MTLIKKNDTVYILSGRDKGKNGRVLHVYPKIDKALVEGVNYVKRHQRKTSQQDQQGGIVQKESPIQLSNIALFCKICKKGTRVGRTVLADGTKSRFCKRCKETI